MASDYARNVVHCKLSSLVGDSPPQVILGAAVFDQPSNYPGRRCWVYSEFEFQTFAAEQQDTFALVPEFNLPDVGRVDYAIFASHVSMQEPLLVLEIDGHRYHCTPDQVSNDHRRDRTLTRRGIPCLRFTGTDVVRNSTSHAREVVDNVHIKLQERATREARVTELWNIGPHHSGLIFAVLMSYDQLS